MNQRRGLSVWWWRVEWWRVEWWRSGRWNNYCGPVNRGLVGRYHLYNWKMSRVRTKTEEENKKENLIQLVIFEHITISSI